MHDYARRVFLRRLSADNAASLGESPLWPTAAVVTSAALYADLPARFIAGSSAGAFAVARWIVPILTALLLVALLASLPGSQLVRRLGWHPQRVHVTRRWLSLTLIAIVRVANAASIALLVHLLIGGAHANAPTLLRAAIHLWTVNVLLFALWFWQLDGGGPAARLTCAPAERDFLFPQQADPSFAAADWRPKFLDYLYVSFTNATAFSPTDTMPLTAAAKALMMLQSLASLLTVALVVSRAVNILK